MPLNEADRVWLTTRIRTGSFPAQQVRRARILLESDRISTFVAGQEWFHRGGDAGHRHGDLPLLTDEVLNRGGEADHLVAIQIMQFVDDDQEPGRHLAHPGIRFLLHAEQCRQNVSQGGFRDISSPRSPRQSEPAKGDSGELRLILPQVRVNRTLDLITEIVDKAPTCRHREYTPALLSARDILQNIPEIIKDLLPADQRRRTRPKSCPEGITDSPHTFSADPSALQMFILFTLI